MDAKERPSSERRVLGAKVKRAVANGTFLLSFLSRMLVYKLQPGRARGTEGAYKVKGQGERGKGTERVGTKPDRGERSPGRREPEREREREREQREERGNARLGLGGSRAGDRNERENTRDDRDGD